MNYPLYDLHDHEFENLVASICEEILGTGTINFSEGKDGGRDAKFTGLANNFPSHTKPWEGKIVIEAKHTERQNASCSDSDFQTILKKDIKNNLLKLLQEKRIDYYLLFTNRKLSGIQDAKIEDFIDDKIQVENYVIGDERIQKWLRDYPNIFRKHNLDKLLLPLQFYEDDLKEIIIAFSKIKIDPDEINKINDSFSKIDIVEKNRLNELSKDYFDNVLKKSYSYFNKIDLFLKDPKNDKFKRYYNNTVADLQEKIIVKRDEYSTFDEILAHLYDYVFLNDQMALKDKRNLIRLFLHYMYHFCDIGKSE